MNDLEIRDVTAFLGPELEPARVDLVVCAGLIASIRPASGEPPSDGAGGVLDGAGLLAIPGFIDCHDHLRNLTPGVPQTEGVPLDKLLPLLWAMQEHMGVSEYRVTALLGALQRLKAGVTTLVDHCYPFHEPGLDEASIAGYKQSGVKWFYARGVMTRPHPGLSETWSSAERHIRELVESGAVPAERLLIAPVSIRQVSPQDIEHSRHLADDLGCLLQMHVAETAAEADLWVQACGSGPFKALDNLGFLTSRTQLVHCIFMEDQDVELLAARACHVVDCPAIHLDSGKGFTPSARLLAAGVNVAIGLDKLNDPFLEVRLEAGLHGAGAPASGIDRKGAFAMATLRGARALGLEGKTGVLAEGMSSDIVLVDGTSLRHAPVIDPAQVLFFASPESVRHVVVEGQLVVRDGKSTLVDEPALVLEVQEIAKHYLRRAGQDRTPWFQERSPASANA
jgi:5-methylthioadenosine/S-adenosylhomocysteine deaminase